ncbi:hypothetical protein K438DRAFT_353361 [Mycena galopus ATCC 62051]|nr:hypothetical protein K438DRAFT_353361 [Mycena galopus ATCC 62051]
MAASGFGWRELQPHRCTYNITHSTGYTTEGYGTTGINSTQGTEGGDAAGIAPDAPLDLPAHLAACSVISNAIEGKTLLPVMSARLSTRKSASLKFGRVQVVAKLPPACDPPCYENRI